jgi:hypothetical protein
VRQRPLIGPADWLRLCRQLGLTLPDKARLLPMLGLRLDRPAIAKSTESAAPEQPAIAPTPITPPPQPAPEPAPSPPPSSERNLAWIEEIRLAPPSPIPTSLGAARPMAREAWDPPEMSTLDPLFDQRLERTLLIAALARERRTSELNIDELVRRAGRIDLRRRLPLLVRKSLRLGCQIIFDQSEIMELFVQDQVRLIEHVRAIVPEGRLSVVPAPFGAPDEDSWSLPDPGRPVLALSDLGTIRTFVPVAQRGPEAWLEVARQVADHGSDLIVFFTGRLEAVPGSLRRLALIVLWDHNARTGSVDRRRRERRGR